MVFIYLLNLLRLICINPSKAVGGKLGRKTPWCCSKTLKWGWVLTNKSRSCLHEETSHCFTMRRYHSVAMISQHTALARVTHGFKCFESSEASFTVWLVASTLGDEHTRVRSHSTDIQSILLGESPVDYLIKKNKQHVKTKLVKG